jgi:glycopeptide antibiotics resistance protein
MKQRALPSTILLAYSALLVRVMVFKDIPVIRVGGLMLNFGGTDGGHPPNFIPFKTIKPYLLGDNLIIASANLVGNVALLIPVGILIPFIWRMMTWKQALLIAVIAGLSIELSQVVLRIGIFDIDDVILNALGVMIGYWLHRLLGIIGERG